MDALTPPGESATPHPINVATGLALRKQIRISGLSFASVARAAGMSARSLSRKLNGERALTVPEIHAIATALDVEPEALVAFAEKAA